MVAPSLHQQSPSLSFFIFFTILNFTIHCRVILNPQACVHSFANALLLVAQQKSRSSHAFEQWHWVMCALSGAFWVRVLCCLTTGTDVPKLACKMDALLCFAGMSWLLMTRNRARRTQQRTEQGKAQTAWRSFILVALPSEHSKPTSLAA